MLGLVGRLVLVVSLPAVSVIAGLVTYAVGLGGRLAVRSVTRRG